MKKRNPKLNLSARIIPLLMFAWLSTATAIANERAEICKKAGQYCVNRETSSGTCHVQETTESPLGVNILGPYVSRKEGSTAMCNAYDPGSTEPTKCAAVAPSDACDNKQLGVAKRKGASSQKIVRTTGVKSQVCAVKKTIWTNSGDKAIVVSAKFKDNCHEPEDQGEVSIFDHSNNQVGTTFKFSKGYWVTVPLTIPAQGHIEYLCHSNSSMQELQCMYEIAEASKKAADKDPCSTVYPIPDGADQWTNCVKSGASACGGPDKCDCATSERLVQYSCSEGKYDKCTAESACSLSKK